MGNSQRVKDFGTLSLRLDVFITFLKDQGSSWLKAERLWDRDVAWLQGNHAFQTQQDCCTYALTECDHRQKLCTTSSQTKSQHRKAEVDTQTYPYPRSCLQLIVARRGKSYSVRWSGTLQISTLQNGSHAQEKFINTNLTPDFWCVLFFFNLFSFSTRSRTWRWIGREVGKVKEYDRIHCMKFSKTKTIKGPNYYCFLLLRQYIFIWRKLKI